MTSRYCLISPIETVREAFGFTGGEPYPPRYNIAPTQPVAVVRHGFDHARELALVRWGLIPSWVKDPSTLSLMINARAETATEKTSFRGPMRHRRCLVPADGYYEWFGPAGARRVLLARPRDGRPMALAGLWDHWLGADGSEIETVAIVTVKAGERLARFNERMPVILAPADYEAWLDTRSGTAGPASGLLRPAPDDALEVVEVGAGISNPRSEGPELHEIVSKILP